MIFIRKLFALILTLGLGWTLYIYGAGHMLSTSLVDVSAGDMPTTPIEIPAYISSDALIVIAEKRISTADPIVLALKALSQDPANGGAVAFLLAQFTITGRNVEAAEAANLAGRLWPVQTYTHARLADYWITQNRIDKVIPELSLLMVRDSGIYRVLFPVLEELTINSGKPELLAPYVNEPPSWWNAFFTYLSGRLSTEALADIYKLRLASGDDIDEKERSTFIKRLIKENNWVEAFKQWEAGLSARQRARLSSGLYDGGFEEDIGSFGFGWLLRRDKSFEMVTRATYGMSGDKALRLFFRQGLNRVKFKHLSQQLLLKPGAYKVSYRSRLDALKNPKGLAWRLRCVSEDNKLLAASEALVGRHPWRTYSFNFVVPKSCVVQELVLEAVSQYRHEHLFSGEIWFDDVTLEPISGVAK